MKVRRIDYYPDEYIVGVSRLSFEHQGLYWMVCSLIMSHGGPIPNDAKWLGKLGDMGAARCKRLLADLISIGKLTEFQGKIGQKRAESELKSAQNRIESSKKNGKKGGRPPRKNNGLAEPGGSSGEKLTTNYQLPTTNYSSVSKDTGTNGADHSPEADMKRAVYHHGKRVLGDKAGGMITRAIAACGLGATAEMIEATERERAIDPVAFFQKCAQRRNRDGRAKTLEGYGAGFA